MAILITKVYSSRPRYDGPFTPLADLASAFKPKAVDRKPGHLSETARANLEREQLRQKEIAEKDRTKAIADSIRGKRFELDGTNILLWYTEKPNLPQLLSLIVFLAEAGANLTCFFDASTRYKFAENGNQRQIFDSLFTDQALSEYFKLCPARIEADRIILQKADADDSFVISNDKFDPYTDKYPWIQHDNRKVDPSVETIIQ